MSPRHGARLAALLAPALLLVPTAAHAESVTVDDASGDARAVNMAVALGGLLGPVAEGPVFLDDPAETAGDVVSTTIDHARKRLTLTVELRDLVTVDEGQAAEFRIVTPHGRYDLPVVVSAGRASADLFPLGPSGGVSVSVNDDGDSVIVIDEGIGQKPCRTVRARYDVAADTLVASAPTACLGSPSWVQVSARITRTTLTPQADGSAVIAGHVDDAFRGRVSLNSLGRSEKVRRG